MNSQTYPTPIPVIDLDVNSRSRFITRTYSHLLGALTVFTLIEIFFFKSGLAQPMAQAMLGTSWLLVLGGFMVVSWLARSAAHGAQSKATQYAALAAYVVGQAVLVVPLLYIADRFAPGAIISAALVTALAFSGLTMVAFITRKDFSFLRGILFWAGIVALAGQREGEGLGRVNDKLYSLAGSKRSSTVFRDITVGTNVIDPSLAGFNAAPGWDAVTGVGTPRVSSLVKRLAES